MKEPKETTQEERKNHLRNLGWSEEKIREAGEIPHEVMFLSNRKLTSEERAYALTLE